MDNPAVRSRSLESRVCRVPFPKATKGFYGYLLGQWLNFKLFGITYLVGKIKFKLFFFRVHWLSENIS